MRVSLAVLGLIGLLASGRAAGELVYFTRGGQAQLVARVEGNVVCLETPEGSKTFPLQDFAAIIPGYRPLDDWARRLEGARKEGSVEARFAAAWWALENGLTDEALAFLDELRASAPSQGPAARAIAAIDRLTLPCPDPDLAPLRNQLRPLRFREARGPHVVLLHQHSDAEASRRVEVIERVLRTFHVAFAAQGVELNIPAHRLVSVYFADQRDYVAFLRKGDGDAFADTQGYYHPVLNAMFAFDARSSEAQQAGRRAIDNRKIAGDTASELDRRALLLDLDRRATDLGILAHETVHHLVADSGLAPRFDDFPTWLHEGLAAQFEVVRGGQWGGFGRVHDIRLPDWRTLKPAPRLAPLLRDAGFGHGYRRDLYAESWALVYYLRKVHPREFIAFLDLLRTPRAESIPRPDRAFEAFRSAFGGDLAAIESDWHRFLDGLQTPLEEHRPKLARAGSPFVPESRLVEGFPDH